MGRFDRVVTSAKPRAVETAVEMGFTVDAEVFDLGRMPDDAGIPVEPELLRSFADYATLFERSATMVEYARGQEALWLGELKRVPEGGRLLLVSHGGVIESGAVAAVPKIAPTWGPVLGPLEGIRLYRDRGRWVRAEVLRVEG
jgi:broad specificity phosphatase PhoE